MYTYMFLYIIFLIFSIQVIKGVHLNKITQKRIKYIIQHPGTTSEMRDKINSVLFDSYKDWAISRAIHYKFLYKYTCNHIKNDELISYALVGLHESIKRFNGNNTFLNYAEMYVRCSIQNCMVNSFPINALSKTYLRKKRNEEENSKLYNIYLKPLYIGFQNYLIENTDDNFKYSNNNRWIENEDKLLFQMKMWEKINGLPLFQKKIMFYKFSIDFTLLRTNGEIADLMDCSIFTIRRNLIDIKGKLLPFIQLEE